MTGTWEGEGSIRKSWGLCYLAHYRCETASDLLPAIGSFPASLESDFRSSNRAKTQEE